MSLEILLPEIFDDVFQPARYKVYYGGRGSGKCLDPNTPVVYADGSVRRAGDVKPGHLLMGQDSTPRRVLSTHWGWSEMYRVEQNGAMDYVVNENHTLVLKKAKRGEGRYPQYGEFAEMPVLQFARSSNRFKENFHGYKVGWELPHQPISIDPYFLGIWLGDGEASCQRVTTMDPEVIEYCRQYAEQLNCSVSLYDKRQKSCTVGIIKTEGKTNPLLELMKSHNLLDNKHIPDEYMRNSQQVRLQLLAGILDSDAHVARGCAYLSSKHRKFLEQVKLLADSLGFKTSKHIKAGMANCNGKWFPYHKITISGNLHRIPFKIARRVEGAKAAPNKDFLKTRLDIHSIGEGVYVGFEVDKDHCFLLGDGTVCHNSHSVARYILLRSLQGKIRVLCTRELQNSITESVYRLFCELIDAYSLNHLFYITNASVSCTLTGSEFIFKGLAKNTEAIKSTEAVDICWVEEAEKVSERSWELLIPTIRKPGSEILITFNPNDEDDPVYRRFVLQPPPNSIVKLVNYTDNPWFPQILEDERQDMENRDPERHAHVWLGQPRTQSDAQVFKGRVKIMDFITPPNAQLRFGCDWGFGCDPSTLVRCFVQGRGLYIDYQWYEFGVQLVDIGQRFAAVPLSYRHPIGCDPSRPETIEFMRRPENGAYDCYPANRWEGSVEDGIEFLKSFEAIYIHPRCQDVAYEFKRYSYKIDKHTDRVLPKLEDKNNHCLVAGTLIRTARGHIPIEAILEGDLVETAQGVYRLAHSPRCTGLKPTLCVMLSDGYSFKASEQHIVLGEFGWVFAEDLRAGQRIWRIERSLLTGLDSSRTRKPGTIVTLRGSTCTGTYGKSIMDLSQRVITSTIKITTRIITPLITWFYYQLLSILATTPVLTSARHFRARISRKPGKRLRLGIDRMRGERGTENTRRGAHYCAGQLARLVRIVDQVIQANCRANSVPTVAGPPPVAPPRLITFQGNVAIVKGNFGSTDMPTPFVAPSYARSVSVLRIERMGWQPVYNLEVETDHSYVDAHGIAHHNCVDAVRYAMGDLIQNRATIFGR